MSDETEFQSPPLPALIDDYVAQREALAGLRREVAAAAGREAQEIVAAARAEIERSLLKAQRELLVLRAQVLAVGTDPADHEMLQALSQSVDSARQLLQHSRVELEPILALADDVSGVDAGDVLDAVVEPPPRSRGRMLVIAAVVLALVSIGALAGIARFREAEASVTMDATAIAPPMTFAAAPAVEAVDAAQPLPEPAPETPPAPAPAAEARPEPSPLVAEPAAPAPRPAATPIRPAAPAAVAAAAPAAESGPVVPGNIGDVVIPPPPPGLEALGPGADIELIRTAANNWFEAFLRGDATAMRAIGGGVPTLTDERVAAARRPGAFALQLDSITTQVVRGNALYTARMTQALGGASYVSFVSQLWVREADTWRIVDVRVVDRAAVQP